MVESHLPRKSTGPKRLNSISTLLAIMPFPEIDPVAFSLGPIAVHWYGLAYVAGILLGWLYARRLVSNPALWADGKSAVSVAQLDDFLVWAAAGTAIAIFVAKLVTGLRVSPEVEREGLDLGEHGERAYNY